MGQYRPATYLRGSKLIDGAWRNHDVECMAAQLMTFRIKLGDHMMIIVDVLEQHFYGEKLSNVVSPGSRCLQCRL